MHAHTRVRERDLIIASLALREGGGGDGRGSYARLISLACAGVNTAHGPSHNRYKPLSAACLVGGGFPLTDHLVE